MEYAHILIIIPIVAFIIYMQSKTLNAALKKIVSFREIFPSNRTAYELKKTQIIVSNSMIEHDAASYDDEGMWQDEDSDFQEDNITHIEVSQIDVHSPSDTMAEITKALNMYLEKNQGAASDFHLMKDVVERYCGSVEDEISVMQPIPLYMGLMGTMVGIIVGIGVIAMTGSLNNVDLESISSLMSSVAIAMGASFIGILYTTIISWKAKGAKTEIESNKNTFYSWLQTELLPTLADSAATALSLLQSNLVSFNNTFSSNIQKFDTALSGVREVSKDQSMALRSISRLDLTKMASANVTVLKELEACTSQIEQFNQYLHSVNEYVSSVNNLNDNLNNHLDRTAAIERMGAFFEREMTQVESREKYIKTVVDSVDSALENSFISLSQSMQIFIEQLKGNTEAEMLSIKNAYEQSEKEFIVRIKEQQEAIYSKTNEMDKILNGLAAVSETKSAISSLAVLTKNNSDMLANFIEQVSEILSNSSSGKPVKRKKGLGSRILDLVAKISIVIIAVLLVAEMITKILH